MIDSDIANLLFRMERLDSRLKSLNYDFDLAYESVKLLLKEVNK